MYIYIYIYMYMYYDYYTCSTVICEYMIHTYARFIISVGWNWKYYHQLEKSHHGEPVAVELTQAVGSTCVEERRRIPPTSISHYESGSVWFQTYSRSTCFDWGLRYTHMMKTRSLYIYILINDCEIPTIFVHVFPYLSAISTIPKDP